MKTYILRSLKYIVQLVVLFCLIFAALHFTGYGSQESLLSTRGALMLGAILVLAAFYPLFGYVSRELKADIDADRDKIVKAFDMGNYTLTDSTPDTLTFRSASAIKRVTTLGEDAITVTRDDNYILVTGIRKEVVKVEYRLNSMI